MTILVKGDPQNKHVYFGIDKLTKKHKKAIRNASFDIGREIRRDARSAINNIGKTGRIYRIGGRVHQASAPGQEPANITGRLRDSIDFDVRSYKQVEFGYRELYGRFLEDGTRFIERRPNLRPVADNKTQRFINYMVRHYHAHK